MHNRLARLMLAGCYIELPAVPRASDDAAGEFAFAERSTLMRADTIECIQGFSGSKDRHNAAIGNAFTSPSYRKFFVASDSKPAVRQNSTCYQVTKFRGEEFSNVNRSLEYRPTLRRPGRWFVAAGSRFGCFDFLFCRWIAPAVMYPPVLRRAVANELFEPRIIPLREWLDPSQFAGSYERVLNAR